MDGISLVPLTSNGLRQMVLSFQTTRLRARGLWWMRKQIGSSSSTCTHGSLRKKRVSPWRRWRLWPSFVIGVGVMRKLSRAIQKPQLRSLMSISGRFKSARILLKQESIYIPMRIWPPRWGKIYLSAHLTKCGKRKLHGLYAKLGMFGLSPSITQKKMQTKHSKRQAKGLNSKSGQAREPAAQTSAK